MKCTFVHEIRIGMSSERKLYQVLISTINNIVGSAYTISFSRNTEFIPGQVVALTTNLTIPARLYSIASGSKEDEILILFDVVPDGQLTTELSRLKKGDRIYVSKPFGKFIGDNSSAYWIAAGTGVAPFASMYKSGLATNKILIHGSRTLAQFYFADDFINGFGNAYIRCCTSEKSEEVYQGRLTDFLRLQDDLPHDIKYYLCGSSEMVVETRDILLSKGIPFDNIIAEIYF